MKPHSASETVEDVMKRYPRHEVIQFCIAFMGVRELLLAVLQRLALHATRADYASGNDHPPAVPMLNPSFTVHCVNSFPVGYVDIPYRRKLSGTLKTILSNEGWSLWRYSFSLNPSGSPLSKN